MAFRYFVTLWDGSVIDTGCNVVAPEAGAVHFKQLKGVELFGARYGFGAGTWRSYEWRDQPPVLKRPRK